MAAEVSIERQAQILLAIAFSAGLAFFFHENFTLGIAGLLR
jgi:hypothetical protein